MNLSTLLVARRPALLRRWLARVEKVHGPKDLSPEELWDHLSQILDEILATLQRETAVPAARSPEPPGASEDHGQQRLQVGFHAEELVREYGSLGECVLDEAAEAGLSLTL